MMRQFWRTKFTFAALVILLASQPLFAQKFIERGLVAPRVPLGPGIREQLEQFERQKFAPPKFERNYMGPPTVPSGLVVGQSEIVILSSAPVSLSILIFRPEDRKWQERTLPPRSTTRLYCRECGEAFRLSFFDGERQSEYRIAPGSAVRIYSASGGKSWTLDSVRTSGGR